MTMLEPDVKKCRFSDETGLMLKKFMLYTCVTHDIVLLKVSKQHSTKKAIHHLISHLESHCTE